MIRNLLLNREKWDETAVIEGETHIARSSLGLKAAAVHKKLEDRQNPWNKYKNIAVFLPDGADYISAFFGILQAGMTALPVNCRLTRYEIEPLLCQVSAHTVITSYPYRELFEEMSEELYELDIIYVEELENPSGKDIPQAAETDMEETAVLLGTSGTTGNMKIVRLSETNVETCVWAYIDKMDYEKYSGADIRYVLGTPFYAVYGILVISVCLLKAFPIILLKDGFTLDMLFKTAEKHKATHYEGGAAIAVLMAQTAGRPVPYDISSLRYFGFGGSKVSKETFERLLTAFPGAEFWPGYGMTEASPLIAKPDKRIEVSKLASAGTAIKGEKIYIEADGIISDTPFTKGEIIVKGPNVMLGYYKNEKETNKVIKNGFLYTGDIGYLDEDGYLYICGRKKNVIMVRGFSVYAEEIEICILNSRLVRDCRVYGSRDELGNETVCADVVPASGQVGEDEIRDYCRKHLSGYKQPRNIRVVEKLEKTTTGKNKIKSKDNKE